MEAALLARREGRSDSTDSGVVLSMLARASVYALMASAYMLDLNNVFPFSFRVMEGCSSDSHSIR